MSNEHHVPAARYYAHCFHSWLHEGEKKVRFKILLSGGVVIATTIVLIDPDHGRPFGHDRDHHQPHLDLGLTP